MPSLVRPDVSPPIKDLRPLPDQQTNSRQINQPNRHNATTTDGAAYAAVAVYCAANHSGLSAGIPHPDFPAIPQRLYSLLAL